MNTFKQTLGQFPAMFGNLKKEGSLQKCTFQTFISANVFMKHHHLIMADKLHSGQTQMNMVNITVSHNCLFHIPQLEVNAKLSCQVSI